MPVEMMVEYLTVMTVDAGPWGWGQGES